MDIRFDIKNARQVGLRFDQFPPEIYDDLRIAINDLAHQLFALVQSETPDLTGQLRGQEMVRVFTDPKKITGSVAVVTRDKQSAIKAATLEYGSTGKSVKVKSKTMRLDHVFDHVLDEPMEVIVKAYNRTPNVEEFRFERGPLEVMQPIVAARLNAVVAAAVKAANA